ncbi:phytoene desaturase [Raineyella antarctica]|uniref:Phytoene desaturase n=1 Tax=Raineyella antarctica TaxID=1577474 RepID=A0A1G6IL83_9ACTN|nr:phytoene desaturase family protein [Raineyella antarctica]SDC07247.1 phytoene desaturase [Raineyella antarctica]
MSTVIVVGAGLAGLSAAAHLRKDGNEVVVVEREATPGGRSGRMERDGFTFDTGPTVLTMVDLVREPFTALGARMEDHLDLQVLDPAYRARYADGSTLHVRHGHQAMRAEIEAQSGPADAAAFDDFVDWLRALYAVEMPHFIETNFDSPLDLLRHPLAAAELLRLRGFGRLGPEIRRRFRDDRLHRLFSFQAMYAGLAPDQALALYAVITYMDSVEGVYFPAGGMRAVPQAMTAAAEAAGVTFRFGESVAALDRGTDGRVTGVTLEGGERLAADAVVVTLDLPTAYSRLLPDLTPPRAVRKGSYSPSALVWHLGVRGTPGPEVAHHNIHFGQQWSEAFHDLLKRGTAMADPSRFVCVPSLHDATAAPEGCSTMYVLEPVPNLQVGRLDWALEGPRLRDRLHGFLAAEGYPIDIVTEELVTPVDWRDQGMAAGTPFALAHTFPQTGPFRPPNVDRRVPGLVFAGSGTVPGVGVPMVLISGRLAAQRVREGGR